MMWMKWLTTIFFLVLLTASGLAQAKTQPADVSKDVERRTGHQLHPAPQPGQPGMQSTALTMPEGVSVDDGITEDEAVAIALWNNPALQAELTALGVARADVIQAGLLANPQLTMIFPFSFRILEAVANWPIEAIWQRPRRVAAAKLEQERVGETLVSRALDLVRDVRLAFAEYSAAQTRANIADEIVRERSEIALIVNARLRAGDISELETSASVTDARLAEERAARFTQDTALARERLRGLLGFGNDDAALKLSTPPPQLAPGASQIISVQVSGRIADVSSATAETDARTERPRSDAVTRSSESPSDPEPLSKLIKQALEARPEVKAGELAIEAAGARAKWERSRILNVTAIAKEYGRGANGFEQGPGLLIDLPIFNRNQGNISRAEAEIERAAKQLIAARQRIVTEVREAYLQLAQAREAHQLWRTRVLPPLEQDIRLAETAYRSGDVAYLFVLETARRYSDERLREADYQIAIARALAQLERSVGRRLIANR